MPNITLLDLSEATGNFEEFPLMPNLSELYLPKALLLKSWVEKSIGECTNMKYYLYVSMKQKAQDMTALHL